MSSSDQWELDGDCSKCRKRKYCSTRCRRSVIRDQRELTAMFMSAVIEHIVKPQGTPPE